MKRVYQTGFGPSYAPIGEQGNCFQACVASILEIPLEEAFDCRSYTNENWFDAFNKWLSSYNLAAILGNVPPVEHFRMSALKGYHLAQVKSTTLPEGQDHMVVMKDGKFVHDPNPHAETIGEMQGFYLLITLDPALPLKQIGKEIV